MTNIFISLFIGGLCGTVIASLLFVFRNSIRKNFPAKWLYLMWISALILMVLPLKINLQDFRENGIQKNLSETDLTSEYTLTNSPETVENGSETVLKPSETARKDSETLSKRDENGIFDGKYTRKLTVLSQKTTVFLSFLAKIWLFSAVFLFSFKVFSYAYFCFYTLKNSKETYLPELKKFTKRNIRVRVSEKVNSPFLIGIFRPVLVLPDLELSSENLEYILRHETVHLHRCDVLVKWFAMAVKCLHFYNPAVYFICRQLSEECEISCDAEVVKDMNDLEKRSYVETVLMLLQSQNGIKMPLSTGISGGKELLKTRFTLIKNKVGVSRIKLTFSILIFLLILIPSLLFPSFIRGRIRLSEGEEKDVQIPFEATAESAASSCSGFINDENLSVIEIFDGNGSYIMSIPVSVAENLPAFEKKAGKVPLTVYCGKIDQFYWAGITTKGVMGKSHTNICTSFDGGENWYVNPDGYFGKGIVENIWFTSEKDGFISYSGGGYGKGISKTSDGGVTWEHYMEHSYPLPISGEDALKLLKHQLIYAYTQKYGYYKPIYENPRTDSSYPGDELWLPYVIEHLEITSDDGEYYTVPIIWDFKIEKETGYIYKFYDGLDKALMPFDPYSPDALAFAG